MTIALPTAKILGVRILLAAGGVAVVAALVLSVSVSSGAPTRVAACPMSHVQFHSSAVPVAGLGNLPRVANGKFTGYLFYYPAVQWGKDRLIGARVFTAAKEHNFNPKILWSTRAKGYGLNLQVSGQRLDAPGSFAATHKGWGDYPSYLDVPHAGCWRVTVTTGPVTGRFVFSALDY